MIEKIPEPLQSALRLSILRIRIPVNRLRSFFSFRFRRIYRWLHPDSTEWVTEDLSGRNSTRVRSFCISLLDEPRFEVRRKFFLQNARRFGWNIDFWPAINGKHLQEYPQWLKTGNKIDVSEPFGAGAIGLLATIKELYQWAWEQELDLLVVFEDDAVIHSSPQVELPNKFDIVFFNNRIQGDRKGLVKSGWGNDGYVISRQGIAKMLEILTFVRADIDMLMMMHTKSLERYGHYLTKYRDKAKPQLDCYHVGPLVTHAGFFSSSIGTVNHEAKLTGLFRVDS